MKKLLISAIFTLLSFIVFAQEYIVSGIVTDVEGRPLPGANISLKGDGGTITDFNGKYKVSLNSGVQSIVFSSIGYEQVSRSLTLNGDLELNIALKRIVENLDEVLVKPSVLMPIHRLPTQTSIKKNLKKETSGRTCRICSIIFHRL